MRNVLLVPSLAWSLALSLALIVGSTACGSSDDSSGDVGDSSTSDVGSGDVGHDTSVADSGHDTGPSDTGHDTAPADSTTDAADSIVADSIAADSIVADSVTVDSIVDSTVDDSAADSIASDSIAADSIASDAEIGPGGCLTNSDCAAGQFCDAPTCSGPGTCAPKPGIGVFCRTDPDMSCGCDGHDYTSACAAHKAGVRVAHYGACATTGCESTADCASLGSGFYCSFGVGYCTTAGFCKAEGVCPGVLAPYCTCAGDGVSTNTCLADKAGTRLASSGACP